MVEIIFKDGQNNLGEEEIKIKSVKLITNKNIAINKS